MRGHYNNYSNIPDIDVRGHLKHNNYSNIHVKHNNYSTYIPDIDVRGHCETQ